jgi:ribosomal protein S18 acetylase RimI-like enzyme
MTTYNPISISEIENIIQLMGEFYRIDNYPFDIEISRKLFNQFLTDENLGKAWLILHQNEIVGYVILTYVFSFEYQGKIAFLDELYIRENARGKGIGKETIAFIQQEAPKLSLKIIYLEVESHNDAAQKLYIAKDFAIHKRKVMKYIVN